MNKKGLAILMRAKMRPGDATKFPLSPLARNGIEETQPDAALLQRRPAEETNRTIPTNKERDFDCVRESMHSAISLNKTEVLDSVLDDFSQGYFSLSLEDRHKLLLLLAKDYDLNRLQVRDLIKQYLGLELPSGHEGDEERALSAFHRIERNLRQALKPTYDVLFERLNTHTGGLKFLTVLRADILSMLEDGNIASLRALDSYLKEKLGTWLSPAALELHQITWDDPASLLEKIVAYEAVHPISNLLDLKRRLGVGRRCFGYLHPAIPGEPLVFIEVALQKNVAQTIQEVLWDDPPIPESEATCALFYSISSTQTFATLSPIPGYMQWLLSKLASQSALAEQELMSQSPDVRSSSTFQENLLQPEEERLLMSSSMEICGAKNGMEVMLNLLTSTNFEWKNSPQLLSALKPPLMRLCARYLVQEKKRGKALDSVANFHLQNGAMIERVNWMADRSEKGLRQSAGIMVNYVYRVENIEEYAQSYFSSGHIHTSPDVRCYIMQGEGDEQTTD
ncbi:hypothetical protein Tsubulata_013379 [Turnera subulata]|uniref:Malonyl-CoA decarboxylase C-terminal domain-containing protein n=1 Tax=Turnera subulata TaxID=218843 RepID=A0A9Q0JI95_9ROSI|nr:hypothetical protein Tsubulata_013379 [Turnera subulata]